MRKNELVGKSENDTTMAETKSKSWNAKRFEQETNKNECIPKAGLNAYARIVKLIREVSERIK